MYLLSILRYYFTYNGMITVFMISKVQGITIKLETIFYYESLTG